MQKYNFIIITAFLFLSFESARAQLTIQEPDSQNNRAYKELVQRTLIGNGLLTGYFEVKNPAGAIGSFQLKSEQNLVKEGLLLSTGRVSDALGPNDTTNVSTQFAMEGDKDLSNLIGRLTVDAVAVEFDFIPFSDSIGFNYFFASEEYPEYVGKGFNDAFAFLIKGPGYPYYTNIAKIKLENQLNPVSISIDNINFIANREFYIANHLDLDARALVKKKWQKLLSKAQMLETMEFDGMTTKLRATAKVTPYEVYRFKIVIADVGDMRYDSGVFLEKESFKVNEEMVAPIDTQLVLQKFVTAYAQEPDKLRALKNAYPILSSKPEEEPEKSVEKELKLPESLEFMVFYDNDEHQANSKEFERLLRELKEIKNPTQYRLTVIGHTDETAPDAYNLRLSKKRAKAMAEWLRKNGFEIERVEWKGENNPRFQKNPAKNRRVEVKMKLKTD